MAKEVKDQVLVAEDRPLWNSGFWEAFNAKKNNQPNPYWTNGGPLTFDANREFLTNSHTDRVFAQGALVGLAAHDGLEDARKRRNEAQKEVEKNRKTLKPEDPPIPDVPEIGEVVNNDLHWEAVTAHLRLASAAAESSGAPARS